MKKSQIIQPVAMQAPFAVDGDKNIPNYQATGTDTSSIEKGFLPITSQALSLGGQPPERTDFNGMFYLSTDFRVFLQNGGFITYDSAVVSEIGGYPKDALLGYMDSSGQVGFVRSLHDDNAEDFVTYPAKINNTDWAFVPILNTLETIKLIYPIGSIYIGTTSTCPLSALFGTWELVAANKALWTGTGANANTTINAGLPSISVSIVSNGDHKHAINQNGDHSHSQTTTSNDDLGARFTSGSASSSSRKLETSVDGLHKHTMETAGSHSHTATVSASSDILGKSSTVQPPAYVVNVWRRTA